MDTAGTQTITVGYDGSEASDAAVDWASLAAGRHEADLSIVTAVDYPGAWTGLMVGDPTTPQLLLDDGQRLAETARERAAKVLNANRISTLVGEGSPAGVLMTAAESAAMLVVGNRHRSELGSFAARSVTFALAAHAHSPLVAVPEGDVSSGGAGVVVGVDGSASSQRAVARAADEADASGQALTVLGAWAPQLMVEGSPVWNMPSRDLYEALKKTATQHVADAATAARASHPGLLVTAQVLGDQPAAALIRAGVGASLVVVGSRGRGGFANLLLGSVSHTVLHHCTVPVMIAR